MIPDELVQKVRNGTAVPLVGSGVSRPSGIASWDRLVSELRRSVSGIIREDIMPEDLDLLETPRLYSRVQGSRRPLYDLLEKAVGSGFKANDLHSMLVTLPVKSIITTNWDLLLENSLTHGPPFNVICEDNRVSTWRENDALQLIKLHGSIGAPHSIVFSEEDYHSLYGGDSLMLGLARTLIAARSLFAVGFGMRDSYVKLMFSQVARLAAKSGNPHYVVLPESDSSVQARYLNSAGFTVIRAPVSEDDPYGVRGFLAELRERACVDAESRSDRVRLLLRETSQLLDYLGADRTLRIHASLGPLATPDYDGDAMLEQSLFGDRQLFRQERELRDLCVKLVKQHGVKIRFIGYPNDSAFAQAKGYSRKAWEDRLRALRSTAADLGDSLEFAPGYRASDINSWGVADIAWIDSRKSDPAESRSYDRAHLETGGAAIFRANKLFDMEFEGLLRHVGGVEAANAVLFGV